MNYKEIDIQPNLVLEDLVGYIAQNGVQRRVELVFKTDDFALYNADSLEVMSLRVGISPRSAALHCGLFASIPNAIRTAA